MKRRWIKVEGGAAGDPALFDAVASMQTAAEARALLVDLCTPAELEALYDRWRVVPFLIQGVPYREIHDLTAVSVTTIGRVARCLSMGAGGYQLAAQRLGVSATAADASPPPAEILPQEAPPTIKSAPRSNRKGRQK